jgi:hypothetical protein
MAIKSAGELFGYAPPLAGDTVEIPIVLTDDTGSVVPNIAWNTIGMEVWYCKPGEENYTQFPSFGATNWRELLLNDDGTPSGEYRIIIHGDITEEVALLDTVGMMTFYVISSITSGSRAIIKVNDSDVARSDDMEQELLEISSNIEEIKTNIGLIDGGNNVNITCQDENGNLLYLSRLTIKNSAQTSTIALSESNINGVATFGLVNGSYKIIASSKPGYNPTNPYTLTVNGTTNLIITIPTISYSAPMDGVTLSTLVDRMRIYIDDKGTNVSQGVIGFPDGNRKIFMLHHMNIDDDSLILTINGTQSTAWILYDNKIVFTTAPALNSAIIADYIYYEYNDDILEQCVRRSIGFLDKTIDMGWGSMDVYENWDVTMNYSEEDIILTCCVLELLQMQIVRMPIALSFGDVGARISLRGAATERTKAASELRQILYDKIREYRTFEIDSNLII